MDMPTRHHDAVQIRPGARVLLIDSDGRVLLFASGDAEGRTFWYPPGGGSEPGVGAEETAKRELLEETGLCDIELRSHCTALDRASDLASALTCTRLCNDFLLSRLAGAGVWHHGAG